MKKQVQVPKRVLSVVSNYIANLEFQLNLIKNKERPKPRFEYYALRDIHDHLKICYLIEDGEIKKASFACMDMNTNSQEAFPSTIFNFLNNIDNIVKHSKK